MARAGFYDQAGLYIIILIMLALYANLTKSNDVRRDMVIMQTNQITAISEVLDTKMKDVEDLSARVVVLADVIVAKDSVAAIHRGEIKVQKEKINELGVALYNLEQEKDDNLEIIDGLNFVATTTDRIIKDQLVALANFEKYNVELRAYTNELLGADTEKSLKKVELDKAARALATEADAFQCDEGQADGDKLADAISAVYTLTGI